MEKIFALLLAIILSVSTAEAHDLQFDSSGGVEKTLNCNGRAVTFVAYENIFYVTKPTGDLQKLSVYIPAEYLRGELVNGYSAATAPIFLPNGVGGYMPGKILEPTAEDRMTGGANASLVALSRGLVVISPAIRGRTNQVDGTFIGKAPAFIVDYKAAVRWIRFNRDRLPAGNVDRIISNGTSAGGALSALLGATGNAPEYRPYLEKIGAADERDDIFAASVYCPITNLENADAAYEWIFGGEVKYFPAMWQLAPPTDSDSANHPVASKKSYVMTAREVYASKILRDTFPAYVNSLNLRDKRGFPLTLDMRGDGSFKDFIKRKYIESAQSALDGGEKISGVDWLTIKKNRVVDVDLNEYAATVTRMKAAPAFDKLDLSSAENDEFGTVNNEPRHFNATVHKICGGALAEDALIKLMNPLNFIGRADVATAKNFRIRHGALDRDTALAIPAILALKLQAHGVKVDFAVPWAQGHGGDYDLDALFDWIDVVCEKF